MDEDEYSLGLSVSSDDEEDDLIMNRLWKVNGNECESSFSDVRAESEELLTKTNNSTSKLEVSKFSKIKNN